MEAGLVFKTPITIEQKKEDETEHRRVLKQRREESRKSKDGT